MRFLDLFAGIGGFRLALEQAGHKCIGFCEIDKFARQTYKANFNTEGEVEWHDITTVTDEDVRQLGSVDIITGGFPCQSFSVAGKRGGFNDTRGTLFFEIARIARILKPRYLLLENVKGLLNHAGGDTFFTILNTLAELGYWWEYQVLNSKDFGVPQNRERVFIVGHSRRFPRREIFPIAGTSGQTIKQLVGGPQGYRVYDPTGISVTIALARNDEKKSSIQGTHVTYPEGKSHCLGTSHVPMTIEKPPHIPGPEDINNTVRSGGRGSLTAKHNHDTIHDGVRIRRLTPLECFRLQGFPDSHHDNAKAAGVSDSQLYKQAGNAVTVNVVYEIAKRLG